MSKIKRQVTLTAETIAALEQEGLGSLSTGIEIMRRDWARGVAPSKTAKPEKEPEPANPVDSRNPTGHAGTANRLAREDAEAAAAAKEAHDRPRREFRDRMKHSIIHDKPQHIFDGYRADYAEAIPADEQQAIINSLLMDLDVLAEKTRVARQREEDRRRSAIKPAAQSQTLPEQTLRLSTKALKGLGMFGTPESLTDEQIKEINADWEHREVPASAED